MTHFYNSQIPPPVNWQDFESLCCDLWREIWKDPNTKKNGRQGQEQHGVDIYGRPDKKDLWAGIQCKGKDNYSQQKLTEKEVKKEVEKAKKFKPSLSEFIIATSSGTKDAKIEELARKITVEHKKRGLFSVDIWCWPDIISRIDDFPGVLRKHFPEFVMIDIQEIVKLTAESISKKNTSLIEDIHRNMKDFALSDLTENIEMLKRMTKVSDDFDFYFDPLNPGHFQILPIKSNINEGTIRGEFTFLISEDLKKLKNTNEILEYCYHKQQIIRLKTVKFVLYVGSEVLVIHETKDKIQGLLGTMNFITEMPCDIFRENINNGDLIGSEMIIYPPEFPPGLNVDIENGNFLKLINNVHFRLEEIDKKGDNLIRILSNKAQENNFIYFKLSTLGNSQNDIFSNAHFKITLKNGATSYHHMIVAKTYLELYKSKQLVIRNNSTGNQIIKCDILNFSKECNLQKKYEFWEAIYFIEEKLKIKLIYPRNIEETDFLKLIEINNILKHGIIRTKERIRIKTTMNIISTDIFRQVINKNEFFLVLIIHNCKEVIWGEEFNLGSKFFIIPKSNIVNKEEHSENLNNLVTDISIDIEFCSDNSEEILSVYPDYYGISEINEIIKNENITVLRDMIMLDVVQ